MKELKDVNVKELKEAVKELNDSGLIKTKIKLVAISNANLIDAFTKAIEGLPEDSEIPQGIADFYNDLYADEVDPEDGDEIEDDVDDIDDDETEEGEDSDEDDVEEEESDEDEDDVEEENSESDSEVDEEPPVKVTAKKSKEKKPLVVKDKAEPKKKPNLGVEKRAVVNPKLSLTKKVTNLLNFADQRYKKTAYFPLDCETVRILESNVGLYPNEILAAMKQDKKVAKKIEKYTATVIIREINKIKSAYSYIVGAIREDRANGKFRNIMTSLTAGKDVPPEVAHYSTVKVARRALLAYLEVTGVDYSVMQDTRKELVKKASEKKPAEKVAPKPEPKPEPKTKAPPKAAEKKSPKKK